MVWTSISDSTQKKQSQKKGQNKLLLDVGSLTPHTATVCVGSYLFPGPRNSCGLILPGSTMFEGQRGSGCSKMCFPEANGYLDI